MLLAIELPDAAGDAVAGKRTLVVRLGAAAGARLYAGLTIAGFGALPLLASQGVLPARVALAPIVLAPIAIWQAARVVRGGYADPARWDSVAFWSVALLAGSAGAALVGGRDARARLNRRPDPHAAADAQQRAHQARRRPHPPHRRAGQPRPFDQEHQRARQPVVRAQQAPSLAIETGERRVAFGQRARNDRGQPLGGDQRVRDPAGRQRIGRARGVAQQHDARRVSGARAAGRRARARPAWSAASRRPASRAAAAARRSSARATRARWGRTRGDRRAPASSSSPSGSGAA